MQRITSKRRKCAESSSLTCISELPDQLLLDVSSYLPTPSRAMFAVALTANTFSWCTKERCERHPSAASRAIISGASPSPSSTSHEGWSVLDFEEVEKSLALKLQDNDLRAMLICIDAKNNLKWLKLAGCIRIVGHGLEPLRGSKMLEHLDLSLKWSLLTDPQIKKLEADYERYGLSMNDFNRSLDLSGSSLLNNPDPKMNEEAVLPILNSIVNESGNSLKLIQLPENWNLLSSEMLGQFYARYNELLHGRNLHCSDCNELCRSQDPDSQWFGQSGQSRTCYSCVKHFCIRHLNNSKRCKYCKRLYCEDCVIVCEKCEKCSGCVEGVEECEGCCGNGVCTR